MYLKKAIAHIVSLKYFFIFNKYGKMSYIIKPISIIKRKGKIIFHDKIRILNGLRMELLNKDSVIEIGENTSIGQNFHIISAGKLIIGKDVTISGNVFISNFNHDYHEIDLPILDQKNIIFETIIGDNCFIGYGAVILPGSKLGKQCIVGANAVVRGKFPDYCVVAGSPAKIIKKYDKDSQKWIRIVENKNEN